MTQAEKIARKSGSNLAFVFFSLPKEKRVDISTFYAFCRLVDDIADDSAAPLIARRAELENWRTWVRRSGQEEPELAGEIRRLISKYSLKLLYFEDILNGVESDLEPVRYQNFSQLSEYCYRVASAVGLVSIEIFGYRNSRCRDYAYYLGLALQLTNIIRDVGVDLKNGGRIYLPLDEMAQFSYSEADLMAQTYDDRFVNLMRSQAERAHAHFQKATEMLPPEDRRSMVAAELMREVYFTLLNRIERDGFRVLSKKYRLSRAEKLWIISRHLAKNLT
ncbi:MAG: squalene/phytoene synthase family protein [Verrucomicrobia bacterium]|nr:squalene/phytoene synthase family protein [Verrucomicrobiota bacterium]